MPDWTETPSPEDQPENEPRSQQPDAEEELGISLNELSLAFSEALSNQAIDDEASDWFDEAVTQTPDPVAPVDEPGHQLHLFNNQLSSDEEQEASPNDGQADSLHDQREPDASHDDAPDAADDNESEFHLAGLDASELETVGDDLDDEVANDPCPISPRTILEAMLFLGDPGNRPLPSARASELMRGVSPGEIVDLIDDLNRSYLDNGCPYHIVQDGEGYRMALRPEFDDIRSRLYGKVREAKLSSSAIETLSLVAYRQPISGEEVNRIRGTASGNLLNQLVRRSLLRIERNPDNARDVSYCTTDRFLALFNLQSIDDLPLLEDLE